MLASAPLVLSSIPRRRSAPSETSSPIDSESGETQLRLGRQRHGIAPLGELLQSITGIRLTHVPYKGTAPAITDLLGGQVQMMFSVIPTALPQIKAGNCAPSP